MWVRWSIKCSYQLSATSYQKQGGRRLRRR
jgi:hypothetical protein